MFRNDNFNKLLKVLQVYRTVLFFVVSFTTMFCAIKPASAQNWGSFEPRENLLPKYSLVQFSGGDANESAPAENSTSSDGQIADNQSFEQVPIKSPMENIFHNTLWGSVTGGLVALGWATLFSASSDDRTSFRYLAERFSLGATIGSIVGFGVGIFLNLNETAFNQRALSENIYKQKGILDDQYILTLLDNDKNKNQLIQLGFNF